MKVLRTGRVFALCPAWDFAQRPFGGDPAETRPQSERIEILRHALSGSQDGAFGRFVPRSQTFGKRGPAVISSPRCLLEQHL
jgi:hypothetical protein